MHPFVFGSVSLYFVMWGCAALVGTVGATRGAVRAGFSARRSAVAVALLVLSILPGSKLLNLAEAHWFPLDDYVPQSSPLPQLSPNFDCSVTAPCIFGDYIGLAGRSPGSDTFVAGWTDTRPPLASGTPCPYAPSTSPDPNIMTAVGC